MKNKLKVILAFVILLVIFINVPIKITYAKGETTHDGIDGNVGKIIIPFEKKWQDVLENERPEKVTIKLYKYLGDTFNEDSATLIESKDVTASDNWKYDFDISDEALFDSSNNAYKFKVVEVVEPGFGEVEEAHVDPDVKFIAPSTGNSWVKIEPCDSLPIKFTDEGYKTVLGIKKGNDYIIWTPEALTESEQDMIFNDVMPYLGGSRANYTFISGYGTHTVDGKTIIFDEAKQEIRFEKKSDWSWIYTGLYYKSSTETNSSSITNTIKRLDLTVEKKWEDHNNILGLRPTEVTIQLLMNGSVFKEVKLSAGNSWRYDFTGLLEYSNGIKNNYEVREKSIEGYTSNITSDGKLFIVTNTREVEETTVSVNKVWQNTEVIDDLPGVIVALYYKKNVDDTPIEIARVVLNKDNNWSYIFTSGDGILDILPAIYIYEVREIGFDVPEEEKSFYEELFITEYSHNGNDWTITNTCTASYELPETGSVKALIFIALTTVLLGVPIIYLVYSLVKRSI